MSDITHARLKELLEYDPKTGAFKWLQSVGKVRAGDVTFGSPNAAGYLRIRIDGKLHYAHRLAWLYMTGALPTRMLDHEDQDKGNNVFENLRLATNAENKQNVRSARAHPGAQKKGSHFQSKIRVNGRHVWIGTFDDAESASAAYLAAKHALHPFDASIPPRIR